MTSHTRLATHLVLLLGIGATSCVTAETLYKSTDVTGQVTYSDKPLPGAVKVEVLQVEPAPPQDNARIEAEREKLRKQAEEFQQRERQRERAREDAHAEVIAAMNALKEAQKKREAGVEPLPGERLGNVRGGSRLASAYFQRQQALDQEVSAAQLRLEQAYARRNDLR